MLSAHSIQEAFLYVLITPCDVCEQISVRPDPPQFDETSDGGSSNETIAGECVITGLCHNCQSVHRHCFNVADGHASESFALMHDPLAKNAPINSTDDRSAIIDLVQWVSLHAHFVEAATQTPDRQEARWNMIRAGECLDEALRFFDGDEQPMDRSAFTPPTQRVLAAHAGRYVRTQLIEQRRKCPPRNE